MAPELAAPVPDVEPAAAEFLRALADPTRRRIFLVLMRGDVRNCDLVAALGLHENLISHHLGKLREAGLVTEHRDAHDARWVHLGIDADRLAAALRSMCAAFDPGHLERPSPASGGVADAG
jgi:DNA-binding transcriptional ArsR family regulator